MDIRKIKKLIELVEESGITELEVQEEEGTVRISRAAPAVAPAAIQYAAAPVAPVEIALTTPALSASIRFIIFIASTIQSASPTLTVCPTSTKALASGLGLR